jgi:hypothetical protein
MKRLFYLLFWILNFLLTPVIPILLVSATVIFIALNEYSNNEFILKDCFLVFNLIVFLLLYYVSKLFIFPLIYKFSKNNKYISNFFERIKKQKSFRYKVLFFSILTDIIVILAFLASSFLTDIKYFVQAFVFYFLIGGGGVFICYVSLILWFKIEEKLSKNCG